MSLKLVSLTYSPIMFLFFWVLVLWWKLHDYGLQMYVGHRFPKHMTGMDILGTFFKLSVLPTVSWIWLALPLEILIAFLTMKWFSKKS